MRKSHKPGPKSKTASFKAKYKNADLGETDVDSSDDTNLDVSTQTDNDDNNDFLSPEQNDEATDYGLEFTNDSIPQNTRRRQPCNELDTEMQLRVSPRRRVTPNQQPQRTSTATAAAAGRNKSTSIPMQATPAREEQPSTSRNTEQPRQQHRRKQSKPRNSMRENLKLIRDIQKLQSRTDFLIPRLPFSRLVRELIYKVGSPGVVERITMDALMGLQTAAEIYLTQRLQDAYMLTLHRGRVTLSVKDMQLIMYLRSCSNSGSAQDQFV